MINSNMRAYDYYLLGDSNGYGQITLIRDEEAKPVKQGEVNISITNLTKSVTEDLRYSDASYIGLTHDKSIKDTYVIQYGSELLKVKYVITGGRYTQVFLGVYEY